MPAAFFDLEGPFTSGDVAAQLFQKVAEKTRIPEYARVFQMLSLWVAKKVGMNDCYSYSPYGSIEYGETLRYVAPFFYFAGLTDEDAIGNVQLLPKARETVKELSDNKWQVFVVTTSYRQHASNACKQLNITEDHLASTDLPLDIKVKDDFKFDRILPIAEKYYKTGSLEKVFYDLELFFRDLSMTSYGRVMKRVEPIGGRRKLDAVQKFCTKYRILKSDASSIGDSIVDIYMLRDLKYGGFGSLAWNASIDALLHANIAVASADCSAMSQVLKYYPNLNSSLCLNGQRTSIGNEIYVHDLSKMSKDEKIILSKEIHQPMREKVRGQFGKLI